MRINANRNIRDTLTPRAIYKLPAVAQESRQVDVRSVTSTVLQTVVTRYTNTPMIPRAPKTTCRANRQNWRNRILHHDEAGAKLEQNPTTSRKALIKAVRASSHRSPLDLDYLGAHQSLRLGNYNLSSSRGITSLLVYHIPIVRLL